MENEKRTFDQFNVPATDRPRWFKFNVFGGWSAAGLFFALLLRCWVMTNKAEREHAVDIVKARIDERARARAEAREDYELKAREMKERENQIREYFQKLDSIKRNI